MVNFTIYSLGFELQQQESIAAVLDLASSGLTSSWSFVDFIGSDVVIINIDNAEGLQIYSEHTKNSNSLIILAG